MIIVTIGGGLGNQMFQYAFYTKLKHCYPNEDIKLDMYQTFHESHNGYELKRIFGVEAKEATSEEIATVADFRPTDGDFLYLNKIVKKIKKRLGIHKESHHEQTDYTGYYDDYLYLVKGKSYFFKGAFANKQYFSDIKSEIINMYRFPEITDSFNIEIANQIKATNSVSIHIRRGDYIDLGIETVSEKFYRNAMDYIESIIGHELHYFVFSNDPEWVRETFSDVQNLSVVEGNIGLNSFRDMQLMSLCKHNIIANSSFSFWGAYLNNYSEKIVIVPNLPFTGSKNLFKDDEWVVLENK